jgi:hypothetical protein
MGDLCICLPGTELANPLSMVMGVGAKPGNSFCSECNPSLGDELACGYSVEKALNRTFWVVKLIILPLTSLSLDSRPSVVLE